METGSFASAAEQLGCTQPAVSLQVRALERSVRTRLFERRGNVLSLTEAGRVLYDSAATMLRAEEQARRDLAELSGGRRGSLTIGANTTGGMYIVPDLIAASGLVLAASGTVTVETALLERPMILMYRTSWLTYWVGRMVIEVPAIGMPNLKALR